ncbi:MAG: tetratricopeptide repeat protein, partial [Solirubrobacteraceae bacterium]|nr:tetratricopeptide repeat protein [Solirubrobacteraceae bacterium]
PAARPAAGPRRPAVEAPPVVAGHGAAARRKAPPWLPIGVAAAAIAAVILAVALASGGGGGDGERASTTTPKKSQPAAGSDAKQDSGETDTAASPPPPPAAPPPPADDGAMTVAQASALNDQGYKLLKGGNPAGAVPLLQRSVEGFRSAGARSNVNYHYALFNLGEALVESGRPSEAIQYLEERLQRSDDRPEVVQAMLDRAKAQAGQTTDGNGNGNGNGNGGKKQKADKGDEG